MFQIDAFPDTTFHGESGRDLDISIRAKNGPLVRLGDQAVDYDVTIQLLKNPPKNASLLVRLTAKSRHGPPQIRLSIPIIRP